MLGLGALLVGLQALALLITVVPIAHDGDHGVVGIHVEVIFAHARMES